MSKSLKDRVNQRISLYLFVSIGIISVCTVAVLLAISLQNYYTQRNAWTTAFPRSILPNMINSDHIGINAKLRLIKSTDLFDAIKIIDHHNRFVNGYGDIKGNQIGTMPIVDDVGATWGTIFYKENLWHHVAPLVSAILSSLGLFAITFILVAVLSKRSMKMEFNRLDVFLDDMDTLSSRIASLRDDQTIKRLPSTLPFSTSETDRINNVIERLIISIEKYRIRALETTLKKKEEEEQIKRDQAIARTTQLLAHDVRKPFSVLKLLLNRMDRSNLDRLTIEQVKRDVDSLIKSVDSMVNDIMDISREEELSLVPVPLADVLKESLIHTSLSFGECLPDIRLEYRLTHGYRPLLNRDRFVRALNNIVCNAIEAITETGEKQQGTISISSELTSVAGDRQIQLCIANDGPALDEEAIPQLFNFIFTSGKKNGVGLGLASCKKIVTLHKGTIAARNASVGQGVEFIITIPASTQKETSDSAQLPGNTKAIQKHNSDLSPSSSDEPGIEPIKILLLEDEALYRAAIKNMITDHEGLKHNTTIYDATTVEDALKIVKKTPDISYAIVDVDLGEKLNGFDFIKKAREIAPNLAILINSNQPLTDDITGRQATDLFDFSPKPLSFERFIRFIQSNPSKNPETRVGKTDKDLPDKGSNRKESNRSYPETHVLIVDDDNNVINYVANTVKDCFADTDKSLQVRTASTYPQAVDRLENYKDLFTHIFCDLNIDSANDGLKLAKLVHDLNRSQDRNIEFFIVTHAKGAMLSRDVGVDLVKRFITHPLESAVIDEIFHIEQSKKEVRTPEAGNTVEKESGTPDPTVLEKRESSVADLTLPELIKRADRRMLKQMRRTISHDISGELNLVYNSVVNTCNNGVITKETLSVPLFRIYSLSEQLSSFELIIKYSEKSYCDNLFIVPFELKQFVERFMRKQQAIIPESLEQLDIKNLIRDPDIKVMSDERILGMALQKLFVTILRTLLNQEASGSITFSTTQEADTQILVVTCNALNERISEAFISDQFYNTPWSSRHLNLDYVACGYLISLAKGHVSIQTDPHQKTISYCLNLKKR